MSNCFLTSSIPATVFGDYNLSTFWQLMDSMHMRTANFGSNLDACLLSHLRECHQFVWYISLCIPEFLLTFCLILNWTFWSHACCALCLPRENTMVGGSLNSW